MGSYFDALLRSGVTEQYDHGSEAAFATVVNPLHVVLKPDGSIRPITDPSRSGVDHCMLKLPWCPLPDLSTLLQQLTPGGFLGKRDLASGFHHVKLAPAARRCMALRHPTTGALQRWVGLPLAASQSPAISVELQGLYDSLFAVQLPPPPSLRLGGSAVDGLQFWWDVIRSDWEGVWEGVKRCMVADLDLVRREFGGAEAATILTDASATGFGAARDRAKVTGAGEGGQDLCVGCIAQRCRAADMHCESCPAAAHRSCLRMGPGACPGGWARCPAWLLRAAGVRRPAVRAEANGIADRLVSLAGSAVAVSSATTDESARRCFTRFCAERLGVVEDEALSRVPRADLNVELVRLFVADAVGKLAPSLDGGGDAERAGRLAEVEGRGARAVRQPGPGRW
ncbi:hypothetical protein PLESTB_001742400 [Pleodorina starrii]|uniref:Reverse transcriptase domain-containing protein n=1 Tax=Pleodorina starrii TaxID=330485 RepID=A0A9W6BZU4_9CHLO|nr:hypothetical protein PLESTB_001742400 [Pleodorina starrii]